MKFKKLLDDGHWAERRESTEWLVGAATFGILALELAMIRWTSSQVRIFAYFNNLVLICAFLGMGLGVALGRKYPGLVHFALPTLLVLAVPLAFSEKLGLVHLRFPDNTILLFGGEIIRADPVLLARDLLVFVGLLGILVVLFLCCGAPLGHLFPRLPALRAYGADLKGSLLGVLAFSLASWMHAGPAVWLGLGCLPFVLLLRNGSALAFAAAVIALGQYSVGDAVYSPYNRISLTSVPEYGQKLEVNRDYHQFLFDLSDQNLASAALSESRRAILVQIRNFYDLPFAINPQHESALIVGGGTGNDARAALRNHYQRVTSVDIDGRIVALGREHHPEHPYDDPRVTVAVDDARAFFGKNRAVKYDVVCYGLLDSHAMFSAMSTLRLDNYVYTEEGIRAAWQRVAKGGHLSLAVSAYAGPWFFDRVYWTIAKATGRQPIAFFSSVVIATTFIVTREGVALDQGKLPRGRSVAPFAGMDRTKTTSDDWPFLYLSPGVIPWGYGLVLSFILLAALVTVRPVFGLGGGGQRFDWPLFLMGAAFLLIETRGITSLSLLFGSTWVVNAAIFTGILAMVLIANTAVQFWRFQDPLPWFLALFLAAALLCLFPVGWLQTLPLLARGLLGGLLTGLPVGIAGIIVPMLLRDSPNPATSLGANLIGAVLGGCLEYYSMLGGLRSTAMMALVLYLCAFALLRRRTAGSGTGWAGRGGVGQGTWDIEWGPGPK